jgi:hypothetical protein
MLLPYAPILCADPVATCGVGVELSVTLGVNEYVPDAGTPLKVTALPDTDVVIHDGIAPDAALTTTGATGVPPIHNVPL